MELLAETKAVAGSLGLRIESEGLKEIDALLREIPKQFQDYRPAFRKISEWILLPSIRNAFRSGQSQDGEKWAPVKKHGGQPLVDTGKLRDAVTKDGGGGGAQRSFGKKVAKVGTTLGYGLALNYGYGSASRSATHAKRSGTEARRSRSGGKRSAMPARSFIGWNDTMRSQATEIMVLHLKSIVAAIQSGTAAKAGG